MAKSKAIKQAFDYIPSPPSSAAISFPEPIAPVSIAGVVSRCRSLGYDDEKILKLYTESFGLAPLTFALNQ